MIVAAMAASHRNIGSMLGALVVDLTGETAFSVSSTHAKCENDKAIYYRYIDLTSPYLSYFNPPFSRWVEQEMSTPPQEIYTPGKTNIAIQNPPWYLLPSKNG